MIVGLSRAKSWGKATRSRHPKGKALSTPEVQKVMIGRSTAGKDVPIKEHCSDTRDIKWMLHVIFYKFRRVGRLLLPTCRSQLPTQYFSQMQILQRLQVQRIWHQPT